MKKLFAVALSNCLYGFGHMVSILMHKDAFAWLYPIYNRAMCASLDIEEWAGIESCWRKPECLHDWMTGCDCFTKPEEPSK